jgi:hypothetical protein
VVFFYCYFWIKWDLAGDMEISENAPMAGWFIKKITKKWMIWGSPLLENHQKMEGGKSQCWHTHQI